MVSTVSTRPSHYEILGLTPGASGDEVARAFAREMGRPRAFGGIAEISIAYETLRDPARRRAYDESLGLTRKREPKPKVSLSSSGVGGASFLARPALPAEPVERSVAPPQPEPEPGPPTEPGTPFIAAALRELARPEPLHDPAPPARPEPPRARDAAPEPRAPGDRVHLALDDSSGDADGSIPWKPVAIAGGGLALAVALLGAWAGWDSGAGAETAEAKAAARVALPPPTTFTVEDPAAAARMLDGARPAEREPRAPSAQARSVAAAPRARPVAEAPHADPLAPQPEAIEPVAEAAPATTAVVASLPLSNAVIARTISRIGYPCGAVASTSAAAAPGVFTVTCTSGHSYRAAPVHGRYRFRRVGGR